MCHIDIASITRIGGNATARGSGILAGIAGSKAWNFCGCCLTILGRDGRVSFCWNASKWHDTFGGRSMKPGRIIIKSARVWRGTQKRQSILFFGHLRDTAGPLGLCSEEEQLRVFFQTLSELLMDLLQPQSFTSVSHLQTINGHDGNGWNMWNMWNLGHPRFWDGFKWLQVYSDGRKNGSTRMPINLMVW